MGLRYTSRCKRMVAFLVAIVFAAALACTSDAPPATLAPTPPQATYELEIVVEPIEAAGYILNPRPDSQGAYTAGTTVTIDVLPKAGWQIDKWAGPAYDVGGGASRHGLQPHGSGEAGANSNSNAGPYRYTIADAHAHGLRGAAGSHPRYARDT